MKSHLIYSPGYDFKFWGLDKIHPFDGFKFSKAWKLISSQHGQAANDLLIVPGRPVPDESLLKLHTGEYLTSLKSSEVISRVIEIYPAKYIPRILLDYLLINPLKRACEGSIIAAEMALKENAVAMNIGGGYHHAFSDHGEGFCFFADAALSILHSRDKGLLKKDDTVLMIDLDAHRGNGFESVVLDDPSIKIFDMYGFQSYPGMHKGQPDNFPYMIPLKSAMKDNQYLEILENELIKFLDENGNAKLVIYNAGNDILDEDPLGSLNVSYEGVVKRDKFVIHELSKRGIPLVVMTSGGYTSQSHRLIAELASIVIENNMYSEPTP
ncbi:histone deacetylase family protein [hydrothermal vent metagenome]|uniref:Histone deacetylase family protein n=1 Tax=hydrothermal vent metagenome TaxID=652676 RepID=A0A3B0Y3X6_9ZZZZ